jgi:hypothetical protein
VVNFPRPSLAGGFSRGVPDPGPIQLVLHRPAHYIIIKLSHRSLLVIAFSIGIQPDLALDYKPARKST